MKLFLGIFAYMKEIWKEITGTDGKYLVSSTGRVKNAKTGRILVASPNHNGYLRLRLGRGKDYRVHRLVAEAFIPNPDNKPCVDHINTIKDDNRVENLRWVTVDENNHNPLTAEKVREYGKPIIQLSLKGNAIAYYKFTQDAENKTGIKRQCISRCINNSDNRQQTGGYRWMLFDDYVRFY